MFQFRIKLITVLLCISSVQLKKIVIETGPQDYYWRDLIEDLPEDAVPGGLDAQGRVTYIGQTLHYGDGGQVLTGPYNHNEKKMYYEFQRKEWVVDKRIKILCSQEPEQFVWISVKNGESVERGKDLAYVRGGGDYRSLGIGRTTVEHCVVPGKVLILDDVFKDFYYNWKGTGTATVQYEALYYRKNRDDVCTKKASISICGC